jgi:hypothetical protein
MEEKFVPRGAIAFFLVMVVLYALTFFSVWAIMAMRGPTS